MSDKSFHDKSFQLSAKAVVLNPDGQCLVIRRSQQSKNNAGRWDFPGGKCDAGEAMEAALRREVAEETGLDIGVKRAVGFTQAELPHAVVVYLIMETEWTRGKVELSEEHDDYRWVLPAELASVRFPDQFTEFVREYGR